MFKLISVLYIHFYCFIHCPKSWLKYYLFCTLQNKQPDTNVLARIIYMKTIFKSIK